MGCPEMTRRELLSLTGCLISTGTLARANPADITLRLSETNVELGPGHTVKTVAYNGKVPGPLLRMTEGKSITVDVINETRDPEMVHWHGFHIPPEVDGAHEEGTPMVQAQDHRRFVFTPRPSGTRWYHAHAMAGHNLTKGTYSGQFGMAIVEPRTEAGRYDLEIPIVLHEWDPSFSSDMDMDVDYRTFSINGKMLGAGEPVRVKSSQRVLFRVLNASATMQHRLALPGHRFEVVALDGNPVAKPIHIPVLELAPGERIDAIVDMTTPGVWILGEEDDRQRNSGAGIVVEYTGATGTPQWVKPVAFVWDYTAFGGKGETSEPAATIPLVFEPRSDGNLWAINGKSYPNSDPFFVVPGARNRLIFDNRSIMAHPVHLHRHTLEITRYAGKATSGVFKDVVTVPARSTVEVDLMANAPGPSLFHCHQQFHMDFGFMTLMQYRV
jgi:FtsP/CotA-like multicopper oxidase with cupredoxin domain